MCTDIQELPEQWTNLKKQVVMMKQNVAPLQAEEVNNIRRKLTTFDVQQHEFRENFRKTAPFQYESTHPYVRVDRVSIAFHNVIFTVTDSHLPVVHP